MPEATDFVHDLVDEGELSKAIADRLDDAEFERVADLLIADVADLEEVPYVGRQRAVEILALVDDVDKPGPKPRAVDFDATESAVSEAAIPLSVRSGEKVLAKRSGGAGAYHTSNCRCVNADANLAVRTWEYVDDYDLKECQHCTGEYTPGVRRDAESDVKPEALVDAREAVLEATLGEKLTITMADRMGYANAWAVIDVEKSTVWEAPDGETWRTRRIRISKSMSGSADADECDLVVGAEGVRIEDPPVEHVRSYSNAPGWEVESVGAIGRVTSAAYTQLLGKQERQEQAKPEGDDTWQKYQLRGQGETA